MRFKKTVTVILVVVGFVVFAAGALMFYGVTQTYRFRVPTGAMMNTIVPGDYVLATKVRGDLRRGQIVTFRYPDDERTYFVARIIGLPNETIDVRGTSVYIDNRPLEEEKVMIQVDDAEMMNELKELSTEGTGPYRVFYDVAQDRTSEEQETATDMAAFPYQIPAGSYYLMGDNRDNSMDSRYRGPVPRELIYGQAQFIYYSVRMDRDEVRWNRFYKKLH